MGESKDFDFDAMREPEVSDSYPAVTRDSGIQTAVADGVMIIVTQAFDGHGNNLVRDDRPTFDGFPGVTIHVEVDDGGHGDVTLSPIHGDNRRSGFEDFEEGAICRLRGVQGGPELEREHECACGRGFYHRIFLSPRLGQGEVALICNVWGCHRSRVLDDSELLSWVDY